MDEPATVREEGDATGSTSRQSTILIRVVALSALLLYLEVLLVRWIGTEIRIFAYFKNLTLIACFLGIGLGCLRAGKPGRFAATFPLLALLVALVVAPRLTGSQFHSKVTASLGRFNDFAVWTWSGGGSWSGKDLFGAILALGDLLLVFGLIAAVFVPGGRLLGQLFRDSDNNLKAYTANILGSVLGVWLFSAVSFLSWPPVAWLGVLLVLGIAVVPMRDELRILVPAAVVLIALAAADFRAGEGVVWSPYQKIRYGATIAPGTDGKPFQMGFAIGVNGTFYQRALDMRSDFLEKNRHLWPDLGDPAYTGYNLAYRVAGDADRVLIVGAGSGNDASAAVRNGATRIDAVEIDPTIVEIGRLHHPEAPYDDPKVRVVVDDARSFFHRTEGPYDLVVFGALDSHTLSSSLTNLRIDNFVYTEDAFKEVRDLMAPDGILWIVFAIEQPYIEGRIHRMLTEAFGSEPVVFTNPEITGLRAAGGGTTFVIARDGQTVSRIERDPAVASIVENNRLDPPDVVDPATDDWPYLYLQGRTVPGLYRIVTIAILLLTLVAVRPALGAGDVARNAVYFLLGAAFLLVEVQSISKLSLLFGSTWVVSAAAITGVLLMIFVANAFALWRRPSDLRLVFIILFASLVLNTLFPFRVLLGFPALLRLSIAGLLMSLPIFFAGLVFATLFSREEQPHVALAWNLLGSICGGLTESLSFVIGLNALGLVALAFYMCALFSLTRRHRVARIE